ncbi:MAG TPA: AAA family ATPase [Acidimicrobiia bacterium]|nr:AAA family ATPase [Acidimicrobiia bacterium]
MKPKILVLERSPDLAETIRATAQSVDASVEVVACTRVGAVTDVLHQQGPFTVLFAGPSLASRSGLRRLAAIHEDCPATSILLAFADRPDASLREIVQAGADDILRLPFDQDDLVMALERAMDIGGRRLAGAAPKPHAGVTPLPVAPAVPTQAKVFTVSSATGGCGKTFMATNMALFLARHTGKRVVLVDLDLQFGEVSTALRLRPNYTIYDALQRDGEDVDFEFGEHLDEFLVTHEGGFSVLAAPKDPAEADRIGPSEVTRILDVLRGHCDYLVVDTPAALTEIVLAAFDVSEHLFSLATVDLPSVRNLGVFLQTLDKLRIPSDNISLILNKAERDVGLDIGQITRLFPQGFKAILPYAREVSRSINMGMPVLASDPTAEVSRKLAACLLEYLPEADRARANEGVDQPVKNQGRFKLFGRNLSLTAAGNAS